MSGYNFGKYTPGIIPNDPEQLPVVLQAELSRIAAALSMMVTDAMIFETLYAEPPKLFEGMVAAADGTVWDPGSGAGLYRYASGSWSLIV
jgi:hypothetical protein